MCLCDVRVVVDYAADAIRNKKFSQMAGNGRKFSHIGLSTSVIS